MITFAARGDQSQGLPSFTIVNDAVALETIEQYDLSFSNPSITNNVTLGPDTRIQIADDDGNDFNNTIVYFRAECIKFHSFLLKTTCSNIVF